MLMQERIGRNKQAHIRARNGGWLPCVSWLLLVSSRFSPAGSSRRHRTVVIFVRGGAGVGVGGGGNGFVGSNGVSSQVAFPAALLSFCIGPLPSAFVRASPTWW